jgi:hypothetical protein
MFKQSVDQGPQPGQARPLVRFIENYLRSFDNLEAEAARSEDPQVVHLFRQLRARRTLAQLATRAQ